MFRALQVFEVREAAGLGYQVPAVDVVAEGAPVAVFPPVAPVMVSISALAINWNPVDNALGYIVEKCVGSLWTTFATLPGASVAELVTEVSPGYYRVRAYNSVGNGLPSAAMELAGIFTADSLLWTADSMEPTADNYTL